MYDVITVGSGTIDVFAESEDSEVITITSSHDEEDFIAYPSGSKILINTLDFQTGGGGTNTAVSFARMGLKTAFLGSLGNDQNADNLIAQLKKENIEFIGVRSRGQTGYSVILDSIKNDRTILTYKGQNNCLDYRKIDKKNLKTTWLYSSSMVGKSYESLKKLASFLKKKKVKIGFNPSSYMTKKGLQYVMPMLRICDFFVLNHEEASHLVGDLKPEAMLKKLSSYGPKLVAITHGEKGVYATDKRTHLHLPAMNVKVKETTGAGDAFASGFLSGYIKKKDLRHAMQIGLANATSVIKALGAKNDLLSYEKALKMKSSLPKVRQLK